MPPAGHLLSGVEGKRQVMDGDQARTGIEDGGIEMGEVHQIELCPPKGAKKAPLLP